MKKLLAALAVIPLLGLSGAALAGEPEPPTRGQMDEATAGALGGAVLLLLAAASGSGNALPAGAGQSLVVQLPTGTHTLQADFERGEEAALADDRSASAN